MMDGTKTQKMTISVSVMLWWATSAATKTMPATIHRLRLVLGSIGRLPEEAPGVRT
jgi:hypothetical protein